jgi:hypothetical protein
MMEGACLCCGLGGEGCCLGGAVVGCLGSQRRMPADAAAQCCVDWFHALTGWL